MVEIKFGHLSFVYNAVAYAKLTSKYSYKAVNYPVTTTTTTTVMKQ